jgi:hypothetical protein
MDHFGQNFSFVPPEGRLRRSILATDVSRLENIRVGDMKSPHTETGQGQDMQSSDPPGTDNRDTGVQQPALLVDAEKTNISGKFIVNQ